MKIKTLIQIIPVSFTLSSAIAQTAAERLEQGVQLQESSRDLDAAIEQYKEVLKSAAKSQRIAAEARYRLAECFLAKGNESRMEDHLKILREQFPADNKWVRKAIELAPAKTVFGPPVWKDQQKFTYDIKIPDGKTVGNLILGSRKLEDGPDEVWETVTVRTAGAKSLSRSIFKAEGYQPVEVRWYLSILGDVSVQFQAAGKTATIFDSGTGEEKGLYNHLESEQAAQPLFENEQAIQIVRSMNQEIGTKQATSVFAAHNGPTPIAFNLEVVGHETIETAAGSFDCAKIQTNINQVFFISRDEGREIVRIGAPSAKVDLVKEELWDINQTKKFQSEHLGCLLNLPGTMFHTSEFSGDKKYSLRVWSTDFAGRDGLLEINRRENLLEEARKSSEAYAKVLHEGYAKNFDQFQVLDEDWEVIEIDGVSAVGMQIERKRGEMLEYEYQIHAVGSELALTFRLNFLKPDEAKAIARAKEIVAGFRWSGQ